MAEPFRSRILIPEKRIRIVIRTGDEQHYETEEYRGYRDICNVSDVVIHANSYFFILLNHLCFQFFVDIRAI